jgi:ketosteroid isomerase-like protein
MKRILVTTILIVAASSYVQGQSKDRQGKDIQQELMRLQRAQFEAEDKRDIAALDRLLTDGFVFTQPNGTISDKKKFIEAVKGNEPETGQTLNYDDVKTYVYGKTAVVSYLLIVKGRDKDGKDYTSRYRNTALWVKQGHWRMAAIHASHVKP